MKLNRGADYQPFALASKSRYRINIVEPPSSKIQTSIRGEAVARRKMLS